MSPPNSSSALEPREAAFSALFCTPYDCMATHSSNVIIKFADDTTVVGQITDKDAVVKKAQQHLFFLRCLRKFGTNPNILRSFYSCTVQSILTSCITTWYSNSTTLNHRALQRVGGD
ncbi:hypothetical protein QTP86_009447 [Hemibagrus guttatus]|nr:hypothetical protein QTP86_009447 [Hemibagrus guttatus]